MWEVLSVHSTPRKRDAALGALKRVRALTPDAMWRVAPEKLEESVSLAGPYLEQRVRALRTGVDVFRRSPRLPAMIRGPLPAARRALKALPQMGEGGAYRMLLFAAGHPVLPVDARLRRVARRLGYGDQQARFHADRARDPQLRSPRELTGTLDAYRRAFVYLDHHGAATCTEGDPHCGVCPLLPDCPEGRARRLLPTEIAPAFAPGLGKCRAHPHHALVIWALAVILVAVGLVGIVVPALPGTTLIFAGLFLAAWADGFVRVGAGTLILLGVLTVATYFVDLATMTLGMKRLGTTKRAIAGAAIGTIAGLFFGLPGLIIGPFVGAVLGELTAHRDLGRAGRAGIAAWLGFVIGTV